MSQLLVCNGLERYISSLYRLNFYLFVSERYRPKFNKYKKRFISRRRFLCNIYFSIKMKVTSGTVGVEFD